MKARKLLTIRRHSYVLNGVRTLGDIVMTMNINAPCSSSENLVRRWWSFCRVLLESFTETMLRV